MAQTTQQTQQVDYWSPLRLAVAAEVARWQRAAEAEPVGVRSPAAVPSRASRAA